jgi:predicted phage-related endonuclease
MVQDVNDKGNFVVIAVNGDGAMQLIGNDQAENMARKEAERLAGEDHDRTYAVYQRVGSAKAAMRVEWKGLR